MSSPDSTPTSALPQPAARTGLRRGLKVLGMLLITLSAITPASSVFIIAPGVIGQAGSGAFWSYVIAAVVGIFMAFVYAELSSAYPIAGGEYGIIGRTLGRLPGFMTMGLMLITQVLITAVIALGVGIYLSVLFPNLHAPTLGALTCLVATALAVFDIKLNAWVTGVFLGIEMLALVVVSALGLLNPARGLGDLILHPQVAGADSAVIPASIGVIAVATAIAIFSYNGYGSAVYFGEETQNANRGVAKAILWALGITVAAELIPVTAVLLSAPDLGSLFGADNMMSYFVTARGGETMNTFISLGVAVAIFNAVLAIILISARMMFSTARDAAWSASVNRVLVSIHPRFGTPWLATITTGVIAAAVCFVDEKLLLVVTGTSLVVVYAALCVAVVNGRRSGTTAHAAYRMPLFPIAPILALAALGYVVYQNALDSEIGRPSLIVTAAIAAISAVYYLVVVRRRGTWVLRGPEEE